MFGSSKEIRELKARVSELEGIQERDSTAFDVIVFTGKLDYANKEIEGLKKTVATYFEKVAEVKVTMAGLEGSLANHAATRDNLDKQIRSLQLQLDNCHGRLNNYHGRLTAVEMSIPSYDTADGKEVVIFKRGIGSKGVGVSDDTKQDTDKKLSEKLEKKTNKWLKNAMNLRKPTLKKSLKALTKKKEK